MTTLKRLLAFLLLPVLLLAQAPKVSVTTRQSLGAPLSFVQADKNFTDLQHAANASIQAWGNKETGNIGLNYAYFGGPAFNSGTWGPIADGSVLLAANATNYVQRTAGGLVSANISGWADGALPMAVVVTGPSSITSVTDFRGGLSGGSTYVAGNYLGNRGEPDSTAYGYLALNAVDYSGANPAGRYNTAFGAWALYQNTTGYKNVAVGRASSDNNLTGAKNTSIGYGSLHLHQTGDENTALGHEALHDNVSGTSNTAGGSFSLWKNLGSYNVAFGKDAMTQCLTGTENTAVGTYAMTSIVGGSQNVAIGKSSLLNATDITHSIGIGYNAGLTATSGDSYLTLLGDTTDIGAHGISYATAVGAGAVVYTSNTVALGRATDTVKAPGSLVVASDPGGSEALRVGGSARVSHLLLSAGTADIYNSNVTGAGTIPGIRFYTTGDLYMGVKASGEWRYYNGSTLALQANATRMQVNYDLTTTGALGVSTVGKTLGIKEGTNAKMGLATLAAGSVVVSTTAVAANSRIFLDSQAGGGTPGWLRVSARTAGTSFTITSSSGTDTSTVAWVILDPL